MRADVLLDAIGTPGSMHPVIDDFYERRAYRLLDLKYGSIRVAGQAGAPLPKLAANPVAEPKVEGAERHAVRFEGGMMGRMPMRMMRERRGMAWTVNGKAVGENDHRHEPILKLVQGRSYVLELVNDTAWHHPIHLHGHAFRLLTRDGKPAEHRPFLDTVLLDPESRAEIAFVADNPGDWMLHCMCSSIRPPA